MSATPVRPIRGARRLALWGGCLVIALGGHALAIGLILHWPSTPLDPVLGGQPITVALAPQTVAPETASDALPAPVPSKAQPETPPEHPLARPVPPEAEPVLQAQPAPQHAAPPIAAETLPAQLALLPPPRPRVAEKEKAVQKNRRESHARASAAPPRADRKAAHDAAPASGTAVRDSNAVPNWKTRLVAQIERFKRYPPEAEARGEQGTAEVSFSVDRHGGVHHPRLVKGTGSASLDRDALAWVARAAPLPPPPPEVAGALIPIVVPLRYRL